MLTRALSWLLVCACMACVEPQLPVIESGPSLILRGPSEPSICAGTFARSEAEVEAIRALYSASDGPVEYVWLPEGDSQADMIDWPCTSSDYACALGTSVYARTLSSTHELVHAARSPGLPFVLEEGLATMVDQPSLEALAPRVELEQALRQGAWAPSPSLYERAGHFMSFLLAWGGVDALLELEVVLSVQVDDAYELPPAELEARLSDIYGVGLDDLLSEYEGYPDCDPAQFHQPLGACALLSSGAAPSATISATIADAGEDARWLASIDCEDSATYGPVTRGQFDARAQEHLVQLELPFASSVWVHLQGETGGGTRASLTNCGNCWSGSGVQVSAATPSALVNLEPGLHVLNLHQDVRLQDAVGIELRY